jgi:hypothetical protein
MLRSQLSSRAVHARLPTALAELQSGWEIWLQFALEVGAIDREKQIELERRSVSALSEFALLQTPYHHASDPALRFVALLRAALAGGRAHVADRKGKVPESPEFWGWRRRPARRRWVPQGTHIGWVAGSDLFLEPSASYQVAQQMAGTERLPLSEQTLRHRLREHGLLAVGSAFRNPVELVDRESIWGEEASRIARPSGILFWATSSECIVIATICDEDLSHIPVHPGSKPGKNPRTKDR